jgi:flagellar biosynthesis GTPase FlhF
MRVSPLHDTMVVMSEDNTFQQQDGQNSSPQPFGTSRNASELFGSIPNGSEEVGTVPNLAEELERVEKYSLTVREATHMFEEAGVPRTERSIVKWCTPNPHGMPRLMSRYDTNERRWFITEDSVRIAIAEEIAKQRELDARNAQAPEHVTPGEGNPEQPKEEEREERTAERMFKRSAPEGETAAAEKDKIIRELEYQLRNEQIASRAKDLFMKQMEQERVHLFDQVTKMSYKVGVLETKLLQIEAPRQIHNEEKSSLNFYPAANLPNGSEQHEDNPAREGEQGWQDGQYQ